MVDNNYYFVGMANNAGQAGWNLLKFELSQLDEIGRYFFPLNEPQEGSGDPMMAFVNGKLDVSFFNGPKPEAPPHRMKVAVPTISSLLLISSFNLKRS